MEELRELARTPAEIQRLMNRLAEAKLIGIDSESSGPYLLGLKGKDKKLNMYRATMSGFSLGFEDGHRVYVPTGHLEGNCPRHLAVSLLRAVNDSPAILAAHSWDHDLLAFRDFHNFMGRDRLACTCVLAWLGQVMANGKRPFALKPLIRDIFGRERPDFMATTKGRQFQELTPEEALPYAADDAYDALELYKYLVPKVEALGLMDEYRDVEMPFVKVLRRMEDAGLGVDAPYLTRLAEELAPRCAELEEQFHWLTGADINSPAQVSKAMYGGGHWSTEGIERGKTGEYTTNEDAVLAALARCKPGSLGRIAAELKLEYQGIKKVLSTYSEGLAEKAAQYPDGRLHSNFLQHGTATGRLSSSYPNLQNLPSHGPLSQRVLRGIVPRPGYCFVSGDYSQVEYRVLAHLSKDPGLLKVYREGGDLHAATMERIHVERIAAKTYNFSIVYGAREKKISKQVGCTFQEAKEGLERLDVAYPGIKAMRATTANLVRRRGYIRTLLGRVRYLPDINSPDRTRRWAAERRAMNTPVQGGARDIVTLGMLRFAATLRPDEEMVTQIHDDVVAEVPIERAEDAMARLKVALEGAYPKLRVPLVVDPKKGNSFADLKG